jgi:hypothetical protein
LESSLLLTALLDTDDVESGDDVYQAHDLTHGGLEVELICGIVGGSCGRQWAALIEVEGLAWGGVRIWLESRRG